MTAHDVIRQLEELDTAEIAKVRAWMEDRQFEETPEMLAAIDEGLKSFAEGRAIPFDRAELEEKVRQWAGKSR
jgi:predicted transcriptional regulator